MKVKRTIRRIFNSLFVIMMSFIVVAIFVPPKSINWVKAFGSYDVWLKILTVILAVMLVAFRVWLYGKTTALKTKLSSRKLLIIGGVLALILCFVATYLFMPEPYNTFDSAEIYGFVRKASVGAVIDNEVYFNRHPHNLGIVIFYLSFVRLGVLLGMKNAQILMPIVTSLAVAITILISAYIAGKAIKRSSGVRVWIVMLITPALLYSAEMYTDSISAFFIALELFVMLKIRECRRKKEKALLCVILAAFAGVGAVIKITSLIPVIAFGIVALLKKGRSSINKKQLLRACGVGAICLVCFAGILLGYKNIQKNILPGTKESALPYTHWVMMGMGGDGIFNSEDLEASLSHMPNTTEYNIDAMKNRLGEMGPLGYIWLLARKVSVTWGDGTYEISRVVGTQPRRPDSRLIQVIGVYGRYFKYYRFVTTVFQLSWLIVFLVMAFLTRKKNNNKVLVLKLALIGIFTFLLIWETNSRYLVNFLPLLIILQEYSIGVLWKKISTKSLGKYLASS